MQNTYETIDQYLKPFDNINDLIKAIVIVNKIFSPKKKNFEQIQQFIYCLVAKDLTILETKNFIEKVTIYKTHYPLEIISELDQFQDKLFYHAVNQQEKSLVLISPAEKCYFCLNSTENFKYSSLIYSKDSILYSIDKIRKLMN